MNHIAYYAKMSFMLTIISIILFVLISAFSGLIYYLLKYINKLELTIKSLQDNDIILFQNQEHTLSDVKKIFYEFKKIQKNLR